MKKNVHFQNSQILSQKFIEADVMVENVYYPNQDHGIATDNSRQHLYNRMLSFMNQYLA